MQRVFIQVNEEDGNPTIAQMDGDEDHNIECTGNINVNGTWYEMPKIKGRGNATWTSAKDKKPYNVTMKSIVFPGINCAKTKKYSFLAEVTDHSLLRNRTGYHLANEMGIGQDTTSADVWMNGEYQGCYTVTPKTDSYVSKDGFMIEQDNYLEDPVAQGGDPQFQLNGLDEDSGWSSAYNRITVKKMGDNMLLKDGVVDESPENLEYVATHTIQPWLQDAWDAIRSDTGYNSKGKYYTDYIDIESFAKMYLVHEYIKSYDVCAGSILFYRNGMTDADKLIAGPAWDHDNALGAVCQNDKLGKADSRKANEGDRRSAEGHFIENVTEYKTSIYKTLRKHEDFMEEVNFQYNRYRDQFDALEEDAEQMRSDIEASALMNHIKVQDLQGYYVNLHKYSSDTTFGSGQYYQKYLKTTDSKSDWPNYAANLKTYVRVRSLWFHNNYYDEDFVDPATCEHQYERIEYFPATCTAEGSATYKCPICKDSYTEVLPIIPHDYQDGTCTVCGQVLRTATISCSAGASVTVFETQDPDGPTIENPESTNPRDSGTGLIDCSGSGQINLKVNLDPCYELVSITGEPKSSFKSLKGPEDTEIENGYRFTKVNGDMTITIVAEARHELTENTAVSATCTEAGSSAYWSCSNCGKFFSDAEGETEIEENSWVIEALGHEEVTDEAVAPTCTDTGLTEGSHCSRCNEVLVAQETVEALGHDPVTDAAVEPTCTEEGKTEGSHCSRCNEVLVAQETVEALGHDPVTDAAVEPTCTEEGKTEGSHCSRCNEVLVAQETVEALGHDPVTDAAVEPTCTETGLTEGSHCSRCNEVLVAQETVEALGHE